MNKLLLTRLIMTVRNIADGIIDWFLGYDFFISYAHSDGNNYPRTLKAQLKKGGFRVFLDEHEYKAGDDLRMMTRRRVHHSKHLVIIGRRMAFSQSEWVPREVEVYEERHKNSSRSPIIININRSLECGLTESREKAKFAHIIGEKKWLWIPEIIEHSDASPSSNTINRLKGSFEGVRQDTKNMRVLGALVVVFAVITLLAGAQTKVAVEEKARANKEKDGALEGQSLFLADLARQQIEQSNFLTAMLLALEGLPQSMKAPNRPYVKELEPILNDAVKKMWERMILAHDSPLQQFVLSPNGTKLFSLTKDGQAHLWDTLSGRLITTFSTLQYEKFEGIPVYAMFNADSTRLLILQTEPLKIYYPWFRSQRLQIRSVNSKDFCLSEQKDLPNNIQSSAFENLAILLNTETGKKLFNISGNEAKIHSASFSEDGDQLITIAEGRYATVWDTVKGAQLTQLHGHVDDICSASFNRKGDKVLSASKDRTARIWDVASGKSLVKIVGHEGIVNRASFSFDNENVLTVGSDDTVRWWDAENGDQLSQFAHEGGRTIISPKGAQVVVVSEHRAQFWDAETRKKWDATPFDPKVTLDSAHIQNKSYLGSNNKEQQIYDWNRNFRENLRPAVLTLSDDWLDSANYENFKHAYNMGNTSQKMAQPHRIAQLHEFKLRQSIDDAIFTQDGNRVLLRLESSASRYSVLWDTVTGNLIPFKDSKERRVYVGRMAIFSPDGKNVLDNFGGKTRLWDASNGLLLREFEEREVEWGESTVTHVGRVPVINDYSTRLITLSERLRIWDIDKDKKPLIELADMVNQEDWLSWADFSSDGSVIVGVSQDERFVFVWKVKSSEWATLISKNSNTDFGSYVLSPFGKRIMTYPSTDNVFFDEWIQKPNSRVWDTATGELLIEFSQSGNYSNKDFSDAFTQGGDWLFSDGKIWDISSKKSKILNPIDFEFTHNGSRFFSASIISGSNVENANKTGREFSVYNTDAYMRGEEVPIWRVAFPNSEHEIHGVLSKHDGRLVLTYSDNGKVLIWDVGNSEQPRCECNGHTKAIKTAEFGPYGRLALTSSDDVFIVWDTNNCNILKKYENQEMPIIQAAFSPDGKKVLTVSSKGNVRLVDAKTERLIWEHSYEEFLDEGSINRNVNAIFTRDGKRIVIKFNRLKAKGTQWNLEYQELVQVWDINTKQKIEEFNSRGRSIGITTGGTHLFMESEGVFQLFPIFGGTQDLIDYANKIRPKMSTEIGPTSLELSHEQRKKFWLPISDSDDN